MNKKSVAAIVTSAALAGALLIGGTFALLSDSTGEKTNTFTVGAGITGELKEPGWDGVDFGQTTPGNPDDPELGKNKAENFVPSREIPKDPMVKNTSAGTSAWVAVTLDYKYAGNPSDVYKIFSPETGFAGIDFNIENWIFNDDFTVAYYRNPVGAGETTSPVFSSIVIKDDAKIGDQMNGSTLVMTGMADFEVTLNAYLVQEEGSATAQEAMTAAFGDTFK